MIDGFAKNKVVRQIAVDNSVTEDVYLLLNMVYTSVTFIWATLLLILFWPNFF